MEKQERRGIGSVEWIAFLAVLAIIGIWIIGAVGSGPVVPFEEATPAYPTGQLLPEDREAAEMLDGPSESERAERRAEAEEDRPKTSS